MPLRLQKGDLRGLFAIVGLAFVLVAITYQLMALAIERNLHQDSENTALSWARYISEHLQEVEAIAAGDKPSSRAMDIMLQASTVGDVFRFKLFDKYGFMRFASDEPNKAGTFAPNLSSHNPKAAKIAESGSPHTSIKEGKAPHRPAYYTETYLPIMRDGKLIAVAEVYVNQTVKRAAFQKNLLGTTLITALLAAAAFGIPAAGYFYRSKQKHLADTKLAERSESLKRVLDNMSQGFCMFDADQRLVLSNRQYRDIYKMTDDDVRPGKTLRDILEARVSCGIYGGDDPEGYIEERLACVENAVRERAIHELPDGRVLALEHKPLPDGGWLTIHDDITEFRKYEARVAYLAEFDPVTDAANRESFEERIAQHHLAARGRKYAVHCINVDHFKSVNETLGHTGGDKMLKAIAQRLQECISDVDFVARLGGDEFAILQTSPEQPDDARVLAQYICDLMQEPFEIDGHELVTGASIGIAIAPADGSEPSDLIKNADLALALAKQAGRGAYHFFEADMDARMRARRQMETDLRDALKKGELELYYQPVINAASEEISGCEALLRWNHPERGMVSPGEFIPLAEELGVIVPIGEWILQEACMEAANWPYPSRIAVNVSAAQFRSGNLVASVVSALSESGLDPIQLELEITETTLLQNNQSTMDTLHMLRNLGVRIAMDDFGTGYSSLSYLRSFPFDKIKLDGSFVHDLSGSAEATAIIRAVSSLGNSLGITTTAEGVETQEQLEIIKAEGYTEVQGFFFSQPLCAEELQMKYFPARPRATSAA